jgi:hypothetical protein
MTARRLTALAAMIAALAPGALGAQTGIRARTAVFFESYTFNDGLAFSKVQEFTVPVGVTVPLGRIADFTLSSGWVNVRLTSALPNQLGDQSISGLLDTETRLAVNVIPGRLVMFANGTLPTGVQRVEQEELAVLGALSSDLIGFAAANLGTGGNVGGGFAGAIPLGRWALGVGATYRNWLPYEALASTTDKLRPGADFRLRGGLEGPLGRRTYVRVAGIWTHRQKDHFGGDVMNGVGNRIIGYASLNQGLGAGTLTLYGFDVFRGTPFREETALGAPILPRGNLIATGARYEFRLGRSVTVGPRVEFRLSAQARDITQSKLLLSGESLRFGTDIRFTASRSFAVVLQGGGMSGFVKRADTKVGFRGFRLALHGELTP